MLVVVLGLSCAVIYGAGDYFGGIASRKLSPVRVVAFAGLIGLALLLVATIVIATDIAGLVVAAVVLAAHGLVATHGTGRLGLAFALRALHGLALCHFTLCSQALLFALLALA